MLLINSYTNNTLKIFCYFCLLFKLCVFITYNLVIFDAS